MRQKIALFLGSSLVFSIIIILAALRPVNEASKVIKTGLLAGFIAGLFLTAIILYIQWSSLSKAGLKKAGISVVNTIELEAKGDPEQVLAWCLESVRCVKKSEVGMLNEERGFFTVHVGVNWRTWGDAIQVEIKETAELTCNVFITSRPAVGTTLIDFGKNLDNMIKITNYLKSKTEITVLAGKGNITR